MNTKILSLLIIVFSFISWVSWAYFLNSLEKETSINSNDRKITKSSKLIELKDIENNITKVVKDISPSVVSIIIKKDLLVYRSDPWGFFRQPIWSIKRQVWWWTGFFVKRDGTIITNKHVISDKEGIYTVITNAWVEYDAKFVAEDPINDIAIIKIISDKDLIPLEFIKKDENIRLGQFGIAIWNALAEFKNSVSLWIVSWVDRSIEVENWKLSWLIQTDAAINPWNSWGPLINLDWKVIWINTAIVSWSEWIWFAISVTEEKIDYMLNSISTHGRIKRPFIWISYVLISPWIKEKLQLRSDVWAYIIDEEWAVLDWSSAQKAWIEPWDIILKINWKEININYDLNNVIRNKIPWDTVSFEVMKKNWDVKKIKLELWEY